MATINLRILSPRRLFYFLGPYVLNKTSYTLIDLEILEPESINNIIDSIKGEVIESDISISQALYILGGAASGTSTLIETVQSVEAEIASGGGGGSGISIVADIAERDLLSTAEGKAVFVKDSGSGEWAKYLYVDGAYVLTSSESGGVSSLDPYVHDQVIPSSMWNIAHNMGINPTSVLVLDSNGDNIEGDLDYLDANNITIAFNIAVSGTAQLSL